MKRLKKILPTILIGLLFIAGVGVMAYPAVSDWWNARVQSRAVASYNEAVANLPENDYTSMLEAAEEYNRQLKTVGMYQAFLHPELIPGYADALNITGNGMMGTITIDKIDVNLPIYHGTSPSVLSRGAGHLEGSSLPTGGKGNHCVISAHRGLPSSRLFTDLDRLQTGDIFALHVLGDDLFYEVDQIVTVLPTEVEEIFESGNDDYCTLMTCTPYGINTHRLLVRGHRVYLSQEKITEILEESAEYSSWPFRRILLMAAMVAGAVILVLLLSQIFVMILRKKK